MFSKRAEKEILIMKINIPITDLGFRELILILKKYPNGVVKSINKNAVWECELDLGSGNVPVEMQGNQQPGLTGKNNIFSNMADSMISSING